MKRTFEASENKESENKNGAESSSSSSYWTSDSENDQSDQSDDEDNKEEKEEEIPVEFEFNNYNEIGKLFVKLCEFGMECDCGRAESSLQSGNFRDMQQAGETETRSRRDRDIDRDIDLSNMTNNYCRLSWIEISIETSFHFR